MSSSKFAATHIVRHSGQFWDVMLVDGAAYTQAEWDSESQADYEVNDQCEWLFQGKAFTGQVVSFDSLADALGYESISWDEASECYTGYGSSDPFDITRDDVEGYFVAADVDELIQRAGRAFAK